MNRRLLWKLCGTIAAGTLLLFWGISFLGARTEQQMSFLAQEHQQQLINYGRQAEALYRAGDEAALARWLEQVQAREQTWAAVVRSRIEPVAGSQINQRFWEGFTLGRDVGWKIHLYFPDNPIMEVTFADRHTHFLIILPQRMRPGAYLPQVKLVLKVALPLLILVCLSMVLYRHVMSPLRQLERATRQFSDGNLGVRVRALLGSRNDELAALAETFDRMAERTGTLILTQRRLIADLSHELRTPLTRIDMALSCAEEGLDSAALLPRIRRDCAQMRSLVEDTLTLAWLENEQPRLQREALDLTDLVDSIVDDARFEYPDHQLRVQLPAEAALSSNPRALGQAIENVIRNALNHTPPGGTVSVSLTNQRHDYRLDVVDQGPGVPAAELEAIFRPFYRANASRSEQSGGYGLGLALARRQLAAVGGRIQAGHVAGGGLRMSIWLPRQAGDTGVTDRSQM